jgi:hypothetical protein
MALFFVIIFAPRLVKQALKKVVNIRRCFTSSSAVLPAVPAAQAWALIIVLSINTGCISGYWLRPAWKLFRTSCSRQRENRLKTEFQLPIGYRSVPCRCSSLPQKGQGSCRMIMKCQRNLVTKVQQRGLYSISSVASNNESFEKYLVTDVTHG